MGELVEGGIELEVDEVLDFVRHLRTRVRAARLRKMMRELPKQLLHLMLTPTPRNLLPTRSRSKRRCR